MSVAKQERLGGLLQYMILIIELFLIYEQIDNLNLVEELVHTVQKSIYGPESPYYYDNGENNTFDTQILKMVLDARKNK